MKWPTVQQTAIVAGLLAGAYIVYKGTSLVGGVVDGFKRFKEGLTFDPATLGPDIELTESAMDAQQQWVALGYLEYRDGRYRLTEKGEQYIDEQKRVENQ